MTAIIYRGDARNLPLPDASVDLIVTSPPFWGQRAYEDGGEVYDGQIGMEPSPAEYIAALVDCTAEWLRVLRPGGSLFVNLGDKYSSDNRGPDGTSSRLTNGAQPRGNGAASAAASGVRRKSLLGLPWRYAFAAMDAFDLMLRAEIIWSKTSAMPESVRDRVRRSHETWFHFASERYYFAAIDEIRTPLDEDTVRRTKQGRTGRPMKARNISCPRTGGAGDYTEPNPLGAIPGSVWEVAPEPLDVPDEVGHARCCGGVKRPGCTDGLDHYAAFPSRWPVEFIRGWCPTGWCTACGQPRRPLVDRSGTLGANNNDVAYIRSTIRGGEKVWAARMARPDRFLGYSCGCPPCDKCDDTRRSPLAAGKPCHACPPTRPGVVLDPFGGTGTTALVASALGRVGISVDLSADYCDLARWRTTDPGQRAKVLGLAKPPTEMPGQLDLLAELAAGGAA